MLQDPGFFPGITGHRVERGNWNGKVHLGKAGCVRVDSLMFLGAGATEAVPLDSRSSPFIVAGTGRAGSVNLCWAAALGQEDRQTLVRQKCEGCELGLCFSKTLVVLGGASG